MYCIAAIVQHRATWVPNTDTPGIYGIKRLNKILKSQ